ncbi:MAG: chemotaxis protein CheX [Oscillospiraceae bacterium]|nr:chemotaxis protein CheX [Oscillospiraceae bacterium]
MDVKHLQPFLDAFLSVMPQLGFSDVQVGQLSEKRNEVTGNGVFVILGIVGAFRGNVVYSIEVEAAKKIASIMMMGMPVEELDELAKSALSELTNMLTATAATNLSNLVGMTDISTPTVLQGENVTVQMSSDQILCVQLFVDHIPISLNVAFEAF